MQAVKEAFVLFNDIDPTGKTALDILIAAANAGEHKCFVEGTPPETFSGFMIKIVVTQPKTLAGVVRLLKNVGFDTAYRNEDGKTFWLHVGEYYLKHMRTTLLALSNTFSDWTLMQSVPAPPKPHLTDAQITTIASLTDCCQFARECIEKDIRTILADAQ